MKKLCFYIIIVLLFCINCKTLPQNNNEELIIYELKENNYLISLSPEYEVITRDDYEDFIVYYFNINSEINGGIYFGNHPSGLEMTGEYIKTKKSKLFGRERRFDIFYGNNKYYTEIIINNTGGQYWETKIHLWALGETITEIENMLFYYSTIRRKN